MAASSTADSHGSRHPDANPPAWQQLIVVMAHALRFRLALFYGASFAAIGISLPYWPVWLAAQGLTPAEIGLLLAANYWPRVVTSVAIP